MLISPVALSSSAPPRSLSSVSLSSSHPSCFLHHSHLRRHDYCPRPNYYLRCRSHKYCPHLFHRNYHHHHHQQQQQLGSALIVRIIYSDSSVTPKNVRRGASCKVTCMPRKCCPKFNVPSFYESKTTRT